MQSGQDPLSFDAWSALGSGVMEIEIDEGTDTYRVVYVARFEEAVYMLHCSQKKSKRGRSIPRRDEHVIEQRYKDVVRDRPAR